MSMRSRTRRRRFRWTPRADPANSRAGTRPRRALAWVAAAACAASVGGAVRGQDWVEVDELTSPGQPFGHFGSSCDLSGNTLVVGAPAGSQAFPDQGSVLVFQRSAPGVWSYVTRLVPSSSWPDDEFGAAVAILDDVIAVTMPGSQIVVPQNGDARIFERDLGGPDAWGESVVILPPWNGFYGPATLSGDTLLVGRASFQRDLGGQNAWGFAGGLVTSMGTGFSQASAVSGDTALAAGPNETVSVNQRAPGGGAWSEVQILPSPAASSAAFGLAVAIDGDTAVIGAPLGLGTNSIGSGTAFVYERDPAGSWSLAAELLSPDPSDGDEYGSAVAVSQDVVVIGAPRKDVGYVPSSVSGLAFDSATGRLMGTDGALELFRIDTATALISQISELTFPRVEGLAYDPDLGLLYAVERGGTLLMTLDPANAQETVIGVHGFPNLSGLAYDPGADVLYGTDVVLDELIVLDTATGAGTVVGPLGFDSVRGLAFDSIGGRLFGSDVATDVLIEIDVTTGAGTLVGPIGFKTRGLAFDPVQGRLLGVAHGTKDVIVIDTGTGAGQVLAGLTYVRDAGAAYVATRVGGTWTPPVPLSFSTQEKDDLIGVSVAVDGGLLAVGALSGDSASFTGSVHVFERSSPLIYCTAGTSASGCRAAISSTGTPSATAPSGFELRSTSIEGGKDGIFYFGANGRQALPWGNGSSFQCVVPPVHRTVLLSAGGGSGTCDGAVDLDLNAIWCGGCNKPHHNPGAGSLVQAQLWYRDPLNTSNQTTSLSDAIEFVVGP